MEKILHEINRDYVQIKKTERAFNNRIVRIVLKEILDKMREYNPLFNSMKPRLAYLGSYYDGLQVGHATEFDINIVLTFPTDYKKIKLDATNMKYDYTSVIMPSESDGLCKSPSTNYKGITEFCCDTTYRVSAKKFLSWVHSIVGTAITRLPKENDKYVININGKVYQIIVKISCLGNIITIIGNDVIIDIDLVPTIAFDYPKVPLNCEVDFSSNIFKNITEYFIVPELTGDDYAWRLTFPYQELFMLTDKNNLKSVVKLIKLLRNTQGFHEISSFYIKTLFLWETSRKPDNFWQKPLSYLLIYMLKELRCQLETKTIENYWTPSRNLLKNIKEETCQNWFNRLTVILNVIEKYKQDNPYIVKEYFTKHQIK